MKVPHINFVERPAKAIPPRLLVLLVVAVALFAIDTWQARRAGRVHEAQALDAYAEAARSAADASSAAKRLDAESGDPSDQRTIDHVKVLRAIESLRLPGVRLSSLVIDPEEAIARIELELASFDQVSECLDLLNSASPDLRWKATVAQAGDGQRPAILTVEAGSP